MRRWISITLFRGLLAAGLITIIYLLLVVLPSHTARRLIIQQVSATSDAADTLQKAQDELVSIPAVDHINIQQAGGFKDYSNQSSRASEKLNKLSIPQQKLMTIFGYSSSKIIKDTNAQIKLQHSTRAFEKSAGDLKSAAALADYNAKVSKALTNVLEYNAAEDTKDFNLGSDDTNHRLQLAANGLKKSYNQLNSLKGKYQDKGLTNVLGLTQALRAARDNLAKTGDTKAWVKDVNDIQNSIISNRQAFWSSNAIKTVNLLHSDAERLTKLINPWSQLQKTYNIK